MDPLDGTKEFIKRVPHFTVNIALIKGQAPVMGVVYTPAAATTHFAVAGQGAFVRCVPHSIHELKSPTNLDILQVEYAPLAPLNRSHAPDNLLPTTARSFQRQYSACGHK